MEQVLIAPALLLPTLSFYVFATIMVVSALMVISARHPVHSVLFLILAFFNAAGLFVLLGAEFLAMLLVIVYVGAVAVLFLFVVMMLDVDFSALKAGFTAHLPVGIAVGVVMFAELVMMFGATATASLQLATAESPIPDNITNTKALGQLLYTYFAYPFQISGLILLVAMVGAIVLTLRHREGVKRQDIGKQVSRTRAESMEIIQVQSGKGI